MKWLITGGAGFIGTNAAKRLIEAGENCIVTDNFHRLGSLRNQAFLASQCGLNVSFLDVRHRDPVDATFAAHSDVDVILHLAGQVSLVESIKDPRYDFDTNALGTFNILEAMRQHAPQAALIYASTNKVYGALSTLQTDESDTRYSLPAYPHGLPETLPIDLHGGYSCSKGAADQYVRDYHKIYGLKTIALRQSSIYGGHQYASEDQGWVAYFVRIGVEKQPFRTSGTGKQVRDLLHVSDLCGCFEKIARLPADSPAWGEAFNIGGGVESSLSLLELFEILRSQYDLAISYEAGPARTGDQKVFIASTAKAHHLLDWQPQMAVDKGLRELVDWSRESVLAS